MFCLPISIAIAPAFASFSSIQTKKLRVGHFAPERFFFMQKEKSLMYAFTVNTFFLAPQAKAAGKGTAKTITNENHVSTMVSIPPIMPKINALFHPSLEVNQR